MRRLFVNLKARKGHGAGAKECQLSANNIGILARFWVRMRSNDF